MPNLLNEYQGFHGTANTTNWDNLDDFADDAFTSADSVSWAWIENMTAWDVWSTPGQTDLCAMSLVQGNDSSDATNRKNYEDYETQYLDPTATSPWTKYHFYCDCDPPGGPALVCS